MIRFRRSRSAFLAVSLTAAGWSWAPQAAAVRTEFVAHETFSDFSAGEIKNLSLHREGRLRLAAGAKEIAKLTEAVVWSAALGPDGSVYLAAGGEGKVYRVNGDGELTELFSTGQALTRAMAVDDEGNLYVGTSPNGNVYRYSGEGEPIVFFESRESYIWALAFDAEGNLFVGTGDRGRIFRLPAGYQPGGEAKLYFDSEESHISVLAFDADGHLLAGTSPRGYVYRIEEAEKAFVLFNSPDEEVRQILMRENGDLMVATFAGSSGARARASIALAAASASAAASATAAEDSENAEEESLTPERPAPRRAAPTGPRPGTLYRIDRHGFHEPFWGMPGVAIHSLLELENGRLLIGTGQEGRLFVLRGFQEWRLRQTLSSGSDLSFILNGNEGEIYIVTSNPARVYRLDEDTAEEGEFISEVHDAEQVARWGRLQVEVAAGPRDGVRSFVRTGNTDRPDATWTPWRSMDRAESITTARYFQYRLAFRDPETEVRKVRFFYRHGNAAPVISALRVVTADVGLERYLLPPQPPSVDLDQLLRTGRARGPQEPRQQMRAYERPGTVTVAWQARDSNDDDLIFTLRMRQGPEAEWATIADEVREPFYSFNSVGLADGDYQVEVLASDRLSNAPGEERTARRVSEFFTIDNTPPEIEVESTEVNGRKARIVFRVRDEASIIAAADYILDGGEAVRLFPEDGIFDSRDERFSIELDQLAPGHRSLFLRVADEARNPRLHQLRFEIPADS